MYRLPVSSRVIWSGIDCAAAGGLICSNGCADSTAAGAAVDGKSGAGVWRKKTYILDKVNENCFLSITTALDRTKSLARIKCKQTVLSSNRLKQGRNHKMGRTLSPVPPLLWFHSCMAMAAAVEARIDRKKVTGRENCNQFIIIIIIFLSRA